MTPRLLPVMSISLMLVTLSLGVTGHRLGGPPLCYRPCSECLAMWENAVPVSVDAGDPYAPQRDPFKFSCGYFNGRELMGFLRDVTDELYPVHGDYCCPRRVLGLESRQRRSTGATGS